MFCLNEDNQDKMYIKGTMEGWFNQYEYSFIEINVMKC